MTGRIWKRQMESFILFQSTTPAECLVTFRTGKWLLYCVDPFMIFKSPQSVNDFSYLEKANGVFHALRKWHSSWMSCHISNRKMTSLLCGSFHDFQITTTCKWLFTFGTGKWSFHALSKYHSSWKACHISNRKMAALLWILSWFSNHHYL